MQRVQREVVMAHLALMHMAASDISLLELATKPEEAAPSLATAEGADRGTGGAEPHVDFLRARKELLPQ